MDAAIERALELMAESQRMVALTGAGISTPSGVPDYRSPKSGLWEQALDMAEIATIYAFRHHPQTFYDWLRPLLGIIRAATPNPAHLALAQLASARGDAPATLGHYDRYTALKDSLQGADTQREIAHLRTAFDTERKERDNAVLRLQNTVQESRLKSRGRLLIGSAVLALLAVVSALLFRRNYRQKRNHADELERLNAQLEASNAEIHEVNGLLQLRLLRSQMNPHFIYNGLNSAARMTQDGRTAEALAYLQGFARLLRMVLEHSVKDQVDIQEEMDFLRQYSRLVVLSKAPVGSSARITLGLAISARAMATRCFWPPLISLGMCLAQSRKPTLASISTASSFRLRLPTPW